MLKGFFVTGTDTNVGKTMVSSILMLALKAYYWKPVQSGESDTDYVKRITQLPAERFFSPQYALKASLSLDQAARLENITLDLSHCQLPKTDHPLIVEGSGGVYSPLNDHHHMLDLMAQIKLPVIVVARGTLGTINHTLLTIEAIRQRGLTIEGVIFSGELTLENKNSIEKWGKIRTLFHLPRFNSVTTESIHQWVSEHQQLIEEAFYEFS